MSQADPKISNLRCLVTLAWPPTRKITSESRTNLMRWVELSMIWAWTRSKLTISWRTRRFVWISMEKLPTKKNSNFILIAQEIIGDFRKESIHMIKRWMMSLAFFRLRIRLIFSIGLVKILCLPWNQSIRVQPRTYLSKENQYTKLIFKGNQPQRYLCLSDKHHFLNLVVPLRY